MIFCVNFGWLEPSLTLLHTFVDLDTRLDNFILFLQSGAISLIFVYFSNIQLLRIFFFIFFHLRTSAIFMNFFGSLFTLYDEFLDFRRRFCEFLSSFRNSEFFCKYGFVFVYAFHKFLEYILYFSITLLLFFIFPIKFAFWILCIPFDKNCRRNCKICL